ncbi:MAG TPA: hypothetical protein VE570_04385 [Thermoleophilaceae bacterium]|nr:hypothetical protein [Thermoleophilaceae bacterium]
MSQLVALGVAVTCVLPASSAAAAPANASAILRIHPGGGPVGFGGSQTLEAEVSRASGAGVADVEVDFEVTGGPGDQDGDTPQTPDMTCTTAGGDAHHPATCAVSYTEPLNQGGSDSVRAWIDADGQDSTVDGDLAEGENDNASGSGGCAPGTKGPGDTPEPDGTDCVEKRWLARVATTVDLEPKASSGSVGSLVDLAATVRDQFGDPFGGLAVGSAMVSFELLAGSVHDPGDGSDFSSPDLGTCVTGPDGSCSVPLTSVTAGTDIVCAYLPGASAACGQAPNAAGTAEGGEVVTRSWEAPSAPPPGGESSAIPPEAGNETQPPDPTQDPGERPKAALPDPPQDSAPRENGPAQAPQDPAEEPGAAKPQNAVPGAAPSPARHEKPRARPTRRPADPRRDARARRSVDRPRSSRAHRGGTKLPSRQPVHRPLRPRHRDAVPTLSALSQAALTTAHKLSFPLGLTVLVIAFLGVQGRLDRRDPKLRLAPIDSKHDLVPFR